MHGSRKFCQNVLKTFFYHQHILQRAVQTSLRKQLDPMAMGPIASQGRSIPECLRNCLASCDFPGGVQTLSPPSPSANGVLITLTSILFTLQVIIGRMATSNLCCRIIKQSFRYPKPKDKK